MVPPEIWTSQRSILLPDSVERIPYQSIDDEGGTVGRIMGMKRVVQLAERKEPTP